MMTINFNINSKIFNDVYRPFLKDDTRTQIIYGGSSSGKSRWAIGQRMILDILEGGRNYLCIRNVSVTLRSSVYNEAVKGIANLKANDLFKINKSEMTITCKNGYQIIMKGLDDVEKIKSITPLKGVITDVLIEEATETKENDVKQLLKRIRGKSGVKKRLILLFNPVYKTHWIFKKYFSGVFSDTDTFYKNDDLFILKTTYKDNLRFLESDDIKELTDETDKYFYDVYTLGNWGVLGDLVFTNWRVEDLSDMKLRFSHYDNGLDFGFTNDPTALARSATKGNKLYILDELYKHGLTNDVIAKEIKPIIRDEIVRCDAAEPKSIEELRQCGINAIEAMKGPGSLNYGIQYLKQFEIIIDKKCQNAINEFQLYQWQKNKQGEVLNTPVDKFNHFLDALRYGNSHRMVGDIVRFL